MEPPEDKRTLLDEAEGIILRWDSTASEEARDKMIFDSDCNEVDRYLQAVDEIQRSLSSATINSNDERSSRSNNSNSDESSLNSTIQIAMARLEDEFRNILLSHTAPLEAESISFGSDPSSSTHSHGQVDDHEDEGGEHDQGLNLNLNLSLKLAQQREEREEGEGGDSVADGASSSRSIVSARSIWCRPLRSTI